ncbi:MAG: hypothetical protein ACKPEQ_31335, partial [Dolichospermum sp.]
MRLRATKLNAIGNVRRGGAAWTPAQIPTALWLDAADASTITLNGSTVSQWNDKSGNGRNATQATASLQPAYNATGINGKPALVADANDFLATNGNFVSLSQTSRQWHGVTALGNDVYCCVFGGDIYKQTGGTGNFIALGQTNRQWNSMTTVGNDVYATVYGGDIYKQTGGTGNFVGLGQTSRNWYAITTLGNDFYSCVNVGDIYKQTGGTGNFVGLGQTSRQWNSMTTVGNDVYATEFNGDIYKLPVLSNPISIFAVGASSAVSGLGRLICSTGLTNAIILGRDASNFATACYETLVANTPNTSVASARIMGLVNNISSSSAYIDGTLMTTKNGGIATVDIGFTLFTHASQPWTGAGGEFIVCPGAISTTVRQFIEGYLAWKWELTANLPGNHPFKFNPPLA